LQLLQSRCWLLLGPDGDKPNHLRSVFALAFLAHVWLLMYAYGTRMITPGTGGGYQGGQKTDHTLIVSMQSMAMEPTDTTSRLEEPEAKIDSTDNPESESLTSKPWEKPLPLSQSTEQALAELPRANSTDKSTCRDAFARRSNVRTHHRPAT
jgi:hypothetical protein